MNYASSMSYRTVVGFLGSSQHHSSFSFTPSTQSKEELQGYALWYRAASDSSLTLISFERA